MGNNLPTLALGGPVTKLYMAQHHACAIFNTGGVKCTMDRPPRLAGGRAGEAVRSWLTLGPRHSPGILRVGRLGQ